jgi:hypothetical protein
MEDGTLDIGAGVEWHRLAPDLVRPRMNTIVFDHLAIPETESVGQSVGLCGSDRLACQ